MNLKNKEIEILFRYVFLLILTFILLSDFFINIFIFVFSYIAYWFLLIFTDVKLLGDLSLYLGDNLFIIVRECIAPSAYLLISIVFFSIPIKLNKLFKMWSYSLIIFTFFNLVRILFLMWIAVIFGTETFEKFHLLFYELLSGVVVGLIVVYFLKKEKIRRVFPFYSDVFYLVNQIIKKK